MTKSRAVVLAELVTATGLWIRIVLLGITYSIGSPFFLAAIASFS